MKAPASSVPASNSHGDTLRPSAGSQPLRQGRGWAAGFLPVEGTWRPLRVWEHSSVWLEGPRNACVPGRVGGISQPVGSGSQSALGVGRVGAVCHRGASLGNGGRPSAHGSPRLAVTCAQMLVRVCWRPSSRRVWHPGDGSPQAAGSADGLGPRSSSCRLSCYSWKRQSRMSSGGNPFRTVTSPLRVHGALLLWEHRGRGRQKRFEVL